MIAVPYISSRLPCLADDTGASGSFEASHQNALFRIILSITRQQPGCIAAQPNGAASVPVCKCPIWASRYTCGRYQCVQALG